MMLRNRNAPGAAAVSPLLTSTYDDQNFGEIVFSGLHP
jgi:hypothetical protein